MTDITNLLTAATVGVPLTLTGTISPVNATYQNIVWSVSNPGMTGASISGNTFNTTAAGKAIVTATVEQEFSDFKIISAGDYHTVAIKEDGTLWSWGLNNQGQLADSSATQRNTPVQEITKSTDWSYVSAGGWHTVAIKEDGTLWSWGRNDEGQLGDGSTDNRNTPVQEITKSTYWLLVSTGYGYTVAIKKDGTLWSWGNNDYGQLGDGTTTDRNTPVQEITKSTDWSYVSAEYHTVAIKEDGTLWSWGWNYYGQLGDSSTDNSNTPVQEITKSTDWSYVSAGGWHTVAIKEDGTLWSWGLNCYGQLGDGANPFVNVSKSICLNFTKDFTIVVTAASAPTITSADNTSVVIGIGGSFTVTSTGYPARTYSLTDEPEGVSINSATGVIAISASVSADVYEFTVIASNGVSPDATQEFTLTVAMATDDEFGGDGGVSNTTMIIVAAVAVLGAVGGAAYFLLLRKP